MVLRVSSQHCSHTFSLNRRPAPSYAFIFVLTSTFALLVLPGKQMWTSHQRGGVMLPVTNKIEYWAFDHQVS